MRATNPRKEQYSLLSRSECFYLKTFNNGHFRLPLDIQPNKNVHFYSINHIIETICQRNFQKRPVIFWSGISQ